MKKRFLVVLSYYYPYLSGVSEFARYINEHFAGQYDITVLTGRYKKELPREEIIGNVRVIRSDILFTLHKGYISLNFIFDFLSLIKKTDLLYMHLPMLEAGFFALLKPSKLPMVITYQTDLHFQKGFIDFLAVSAAKLSAKLALKKASAITVTSTDYALGSQLLAPFREKWVEIPAPSRNFAERVKNRRTDKKVFKVGFLGRFVEEKGIGVLLRAIPFVLEKAPNVLFILGGENKDIAGGSIFDSLKDDLEKYQNNISVTGKIADDKVQDFFDEIDIFVLPSVNAYEAFGIVQVEAMKRGVPVIATNMRGVRTPIQNTGNGILVNPGDHQELANAILITIQKYLRKEVNPRSISQRAEKAYGNEGIYQKIADMFNSVLDAT